MVCIENNFLRVQIAEKGAELKSIINKSTGLEYMWSGDPAFWGKTSPILFPIVGTLKDDLYYFNHCTYTLPRHGFARDCVFDVQEHGAHEAVFLLRYNEATLKKFPFQFKLSVAYYMDGDVLRVSYTVDNLGGNSMYFSLGAHPAFKVPLMTGTNYEDHFLLFNQTEHTDLWPLDNNGLIVRDPKPFLSAQNRISLNKALFAQDAIVLKKLRSDVVSLRSDKHDHGFDFRFTGFPYLGIWAAKNADFVCIEPWCGIADHVDHRQRLEDKEGIVKLDGLSAWSRHWEVKLY